MNLTPEERKALGLLPTNQPQVGASKGGKLDTLTAMERGTIKASNVSDTEEAKQVLESDKRNRRGRVVSPVFSGVKNMFTSQETIDKRADALVKQAVEKQRKNNEELGFSKANEDLAKKQEEIENMKESIEADEKLPEFDTNFKDTKDTLSTVSKKNQLSIEDRKAILNTEIDSFRKTAAETRDVEFSRGPILSYFSDPKMKEEFAKNILQPIRYDDNGVRKDDNNKKEYQLQNLQLRMVRNALEEQYERASELLKNGAIQSVDEVMGDKEFLLSLQKLQSNVDKSLRNNQSIRDENEEINPDAVISLYDNDTGVQQSLVSLQSVNSKLMDRTASSAPGWWNKTVSKVGRAKDKAVGNLGGNDPDAWFGDQYVNRLERLGAKDMGMGRQIVSGLREDPIGNMVEVGATIWMGGGLLGLGSKLPLIGRTLSAVAGGAQRVGNVMTFGLNPLAETALRYGGTVAPKLLFLNNAQKAVLHANKINTSGIGAFAKSVDARYGALLGTLSGSKRMAVSAIEQTVSGLPLDFLLDMRSAKTGDEFDIVFNILPSAGLGAVMGKMSKQTNVSEKVGDILNRVTMKDDGTFDTDSLNLVLKEEYGKEVGEVLKGKVDPSVDNIRESLIAIESDTAKIMGGSTQKEGSKVLQFIQNLKNYAKDSNNMDVEYLVRNADLIDKMVKKDGFETGVMGEALVSMTSKTMKLNSEINKAESSGDMVKANVYKKEIQNIRSDYLGSMSDDKIKSYVANAFVNKGTLNYVTEFIENMTNDPMFKQHIDSGAMSKEDVAALGLSAISGVGSKINTSNYASLYGKYYAKRKNLKEDSIEVQKVVEDVNEKFSKGKEGLKEVKEEMETVASELVNTDDSNVKTKEQNDSSKQEDATKDETTTKNETTEEDNDVAKSAGFEDAFDLTQKIKDRFYERKGSKWNNTMVDAIIYGRKVGGKVQSIFSVAKNIDSLVIDPNFTSSNVGFAPSRIDGEMGIKILDELLYAHPVLKNDPDKRAEVRMKLLMDRHMVVARKNLFFTEHFVSNQMADGTVSITIKSGKGIGVDNNLAVMLDALDAEYSDVSGLPEQGSLILFKYLMRSGEKDFINNFMDFSLSGITEIDKLKLKLDVKDTSNGKFYMDIYRSAEDFIKKNADSAEAEDVDDLLNPLLYSYPEFAAYINKISMRLEESGDLTYEKLTENIVQYLVGRELSRSYGPKFSMDSLTNKMKEMGLENPMIFYENNKQTSLDLSAKFALRRSSANSLARFIRQYEGPNTLKLSQKDWQDMQFKLFGKSMINQTEGVGGYKGVVTETAKDSFHFEVLDSARLRGAPESDITVINGIHRTWTEDFVLPNDGDFMYFSINPFTSSVLGKETEAEFLGNVMYKVSKSDAQNVSKMFFDKLTDISKENIRNNGMEDAFMKRFETKKITQERLYYNSKLRSVINGFSDGEKVTKGFFKKVSDTRKEISSRISDIKKYIMGLDDSIISKKDKKKTKAKLDKAEKKIESNSSDEATTEAIDDTNSVINSVDSKGDDTLNRMVDTLNESVAKVRNLQGLLETAKSDLQKAEQLNDSLTKQVKKLYNDTLENAQRSGMNVNIFDTAVMGEILAKGTGMSKKEAKTFAKGLSDVLDNIKKNADPVGEMISTIYSGDFDKKMSQAVLYKQIAEDAGIKNKFLNKGDTVSGFDLLKELLRKTGLEMAKRNGGLAVMYNGKDIGPHRNIKDTIWNDVLSKLSNTAGLSNMSEEFYLMKESVITGRESSFVLSHKFGKNGKPARFGVEQYLSKTEKNIRTYEDQLTSDQITAVLDIVAGRKGVIEGMNPLQKQMKEDLEAYFTEANRMREATGLGSIESISIEMPGGGSSGQAYMKGSFRSEVLKLPNHPVLNPLDYVIPRMRALWFTASSAQLGRMSGMFEGKLSVVGSEIMENVFLGGLYKPDGSMGKGVIKLIMDISSTAMFAPWKWSAGGQNILSNIGGVSSGLVAAGKQFDQIDDILAMKILDMSGYHLAGENDERRGAGIIGKLLRNTSSLMIGDKMTYAHVSKYAVANTIQDLYPHLDAKGVENMINKISKFNDFLEGNGLRVSDMYTRFEGKFKRYIDKKYGKNHTNKEVNDYINKELEPIFGKGISGASQIQSFLKHDYNNFFARYNTHIGAFYASDARREFTTVRIVEKYRWAFGLQKRAVTKMGEVGTTLHKIFRDIESPTMMGKVTEFFKQADDPRSAAGKFLGNIAYNILLSWKVTQKINKIAGGELTPDSALETLFPWYGAFAMTVMGVVKAGVHGYEDYNAVYGDFGGSFANGLLGAVSEIIGKIGIHEAFVAGMLSKAYNTGMEAGSVEAGLVALLKQVMRTSLDRYSKDNAGGFSFEREYEDDKRYVPLISSFFNADPESAKDLRRQINRAYLLTPNENKSANEGGSEVFVTGFMRALKNKVNDILPFLGEQGGQNIDRDMLFGGYNFLGWEMFEGVRQYAAQPQIQVLSDWNAKTGDVNKALSDIDFWTAMGASNTLKLNPSLIKKLESVVQGEEVAVMQELIKINAFGKDPKLPSYSMIEKSLGGSGGGMYGSVDEYLLSTVPQERREELKAEFDRLASQEKGTISQKYREYIMATERMGGTMALGDYFSAYMSGAKKVIAKDLGLSAKEKGESTEAVGEMLVSDKDPKFVEYATMVMAEQRKLLLDNRDVIAREKGLALDMKMKYMSLDPNFPLKNGQSTLPAMKSNMAIATYLDQMNVIAESEGLESDAYREPLNFMTTKTANFLKDIKVDAKDPLARQRHAERGMRAVRGFLDHINENTTNPESNAIMRMGIAAGFAGQIEMLEKEMPDVLEQLKGMVDNGTTANPEGEGMVETGESNNIFTNLVDQLTDSHPLDEKSAWEIVTGKKHVDRGDTGGGKTGKLKKNTYTYDKDDKIKELLDGRNKLAEYAAKKLSLPNKFSYDITKPSGPFKIGADRKITPISIDVPDVKFGASMPGTVGLRGGRLDVGAAPVTKGGVKSKRITPRAIRNTKVYSQRIG